MSKFDVSNFSMTEYKDFQTGHFADSEQFKIDSHFVDFGQVNIDSICLYLLDLGSSFIWLDLGKMLGCKKQSKPSLIDKKFKNHA